MAENFKTVREVGISLQGVQNQLGLLKWVIGGSVAVGLAVSGFFYTKLDRVEESAVRIETKLDDARKTLDDLVAVSQKASGDLGSIKNALEISNRPLPTESGLAPAIAQKLQSAITTLTGAGVQIYKVGDPQALQLPTYWQGKAYLMTPTKDMEAEFIKAFEASKGKIKPLPQPSPQSPLAPLQE